VSTKSNIFSDVMAKKSVPANADSCRTMAERSREVGEPDDDSGVVDAYYPVGPKAHNHHLQNADAEIANAAWSIGEGVRQEYQEKLNHDETEK
jgi:hypothetical protein